MEALKRTIFKAFKLKGLTISIDATNALLSVLTREEDKEGSLKLILDEIKERIEKNDIKKSIIDLDVIQSIVADLSASSEDVAQESLQLFDAFKSPKLSYDEKTKSYKMLESPSYSLLGSTESRANMFRERLLFTQQRLLRSELFTLRGLKANKSLKNRDSEELSTIESLLGSSGSHILFGMLTQPDEGVWYLEDLGSMIKLDLSHAKTHNLFYTEGSHVIVQGELVNGVFRVQVLGLPPAEDRDTTIAALGITDIFGTGLRPHHYLQLSEMETQAENQLVIILSNIYLDKPIVLEKLKKVFSGFEENGIEPLYILMGSFFSKNSYRNQGGKDLMKEGFDALANLISKFPRQSESSKFLIVPGPLDAGSNVALPRKPLPAMLVENLTKKVKHITFASNPCRLRCFTQEIVIFREDLLKRMQRHLVVPLKTDREDVPDITEQLVESILDQAHLCPLPLTARPIHWDLDYTLRLTPLPHLLILADRTEQFSFQYKSVNAVNPGVFSSDFSFIVYQPSTKSIQLSRVPE